MIIIVAQEALEEENEANHGRPAFCALLPERGPCVMLRTRWGAFYYVYDTCAWNDHLIPKHYIFAVTSSKMYLMFKFWFSHWNLNMNHAQGPELCHKVFLQMKRTKIPTNNWFQDTSSSSFGSLNASNNLKIFANFFTESAKPSSLHCLQKAIFFILYRLLDFLGVDLTIDHPHITNKTQSRRYFFNATSGQCERFLYGGCRGNENRFEDLTGGFLSFFQGC